MEDCLVFEGVFNLSEQLLLLNRLKRMSLCSSNPLETIFISHDLVSLLFVIVYDLMDEFKINSLPLFSKILYQIIHADITSTVHKNSFLFSAMSQHIRHFLADLNVLVRNFYDLNSWFDHILILMKILIVEKICNGGTKEKSANQII
jgi:hypothetical protein